MRKKTKIELATKADINSVLTAIASISPTREPFLNSSIMTCQLGGSTSYMWHSAPLKARPPEPKVGSSKWIENQLYDRSMRSEKWHYKKQSAHKLLVEVLKEWDESDSNRDY